MKALILLTVLLTGCASVPMTHEECQELGGDTTVQHDGEWVCCKIVTVDGKLKCQEVKPEREPREPKVRDFTDEDYGGC